MRSFGSVAMRPSMTLSMSSNHFLAVRITEARTHSDLIAQSEDVQVLALNCLHRLEDFEVGGLHCSWKNMVGQDVNKLSLVLWFQQGFHRAFWKCSKAFVGWCKPREWSR